MGLSVNEKRITKGLLKNAHLLCCAANRIAQPVSIRVTSRDLQVIRLYASRFGILRALHLNIRVPYRVFGQPQNLGFFNDRTLCC